jgi:hypothetical protein
MALVLVKTVGSAIAVNYGVHVLAAWGYTELCVPSSFFDVLRSIVMTGSPACSFMLSTMQATENNLTVLISSTVLATMLGALKFGQGPTGA